MQSKNAVDMSDERDETAARGEQIFMSLVSRQRRDDAEKIADVLELFFVVRQDVLKRLRGVEYSVVVEGLFDY